MLRVNAQVGKNITLLFTNDLHSRLTGFAPESDYSPLTINDDETIGGFARIASVFEMERSRSGSTTFTVDAGDFLMGTLFQSLEPSTGFQLRLMKKMGYDAVAVGNHEFDLGPTKLAEIINSGKSREPIPALLLSNAVFDKKDIEDDGLEMLFNDNTLSRTVVIERNGIKAGFFSILGKVADDNAAFAPPVDFSSQIRAARSMVKYLLSKDCDLIVCLSHSGVSKNEDGSWGGEDVEMAEKVDGIDIIISGHTHTRLTEPIMINGVPVVQTGEYGNSVGKLEIFLDNGYVSVRNYELINIDDRIAGDKKINGLIEDQKKEVTEKVLKPLGMEYSLPVATTDFLLECNEQGDIINSNLGPFVADAIHSYVNEHSDSGTDISMVAVGVIRDRIVPGVQTAPDIFRIMSMGAGEDNVPGYPLARLYVTGKELKSIMEILQVAYKSTPANYCYYAGLRAEYDAAGGLLNKIRKIEIINPDGQIETVDFSRKNQKLYSITANSYMLEFIGIIRKMSFGLINVVPKDMNGNKVEDMKTAVIDIDEKQEGVQEGKEWLALVELMRSMGGKIDDRYRKPESAIHQPTP